MTLHFESGEYQQRLDRAKAAMAERGLDGMLLFAPESHFYLTGYDTFGFAMFQCMVVSQSGDVQLLTRAPDLRQAQQTSNLKDEQIHIWKEVEGANPCEDLMILVHQMGLLGKQLGVETKLTIE